MVLSCPLTWTRSLLWQHIVTVCVCVAHCTWRHFIYSELHTHTSGQNHHHHHISVMQLGHLLTRSGLTYPEVSSKVYHDSFCHSDSCVSLPWVIYLEALCLHVARVTICCHNTDLVHVNGHDRTILVIFSQALQGSLMMDPPRSETCWGTFKYFIILIVSTYYILCFSWEIKGKVKWSHYRPSLAQRVGGGIALLFHDRGTRKGWVVSVTSRPLFTPRKEPVPIVQEAGWAPGPVWTGGKSRPHRDSIPDRPARSQSLYRLSCPAHISWVIKCLMIWMLSLYTFENVLYIYINFRGKRSTFFWSWILCGLWFCVFVGYGRQWERDSIRIFWNVGGNAIRISQWRTERGVWGAEPPPPEIPKALQNRAKLNPIVKTVKNCWI